MVTNSTVARILSNFYSVLQTRVAYVQVKEPLALMLYMYYSEFNQGVSAFIKVLTEQLLTRTKEQRKDRLVIYKSGRGRLRRTLSESSNTVSQCWTYLGLVAFESGRKEGFDCILYIMNVPPATSVF